MKWEIHGAQFSNQIQQPRVFVLNDFNPNTVRALSNAVTDCLISGQTLLPIFIESPGGCADSLNGILTQMQHARNNGITVATVISGAAQSAGALTFCYGDIGFRFMGENAHIMLHGLQLSGMSGKLSDVQGDLKACDDLQVILFNKISKHLKKKSDWLQKALEKKSHINWYMGPEEAVKSGFADHVKTPRFILEVTEKLGVVFPSDGAKKELTGLSP